MKTTNTRNMVQIALIGALYTALTLAIAPLGFGTVQFRVSEALTLLPLFSPLGIWGLTLGCFLSNLLGFFIGTNPIGLIDAVVGTSATLLAGLCTYMIGKLRLKPILRCLLAPIPVVLFNGLIVGTELTMVFGGEPGQSFGQLFLLNSISVALGEVAVCYSLGMLLCGVLARGDFYKKTMLQAGTK